MTSAGGRCLVGVLVGGRGRRLGGIAKGLLRAPTSPQSLVERACEELRAALPQAEIALVGEAAVYQHLHLPQIPDAPAGIGPLGGLLGLLQHAAREGFPQALALACDLPFVERRLLARLATEAPEAAALVTITDGIRNPLVARYSVSAALPAALHVLDSDKRSLQAVLDTLGSAVKELHLTRAEAATLVDWDTPADLERPLD